MICSLTCAKLIVAFSLIVSLSSLAVIIRYKTRTIPMNSFMFGLIFFSGILSALFYLGVVMKDYGLESFNFILASRIKEFYILLVFLGMIVSALVVKKLPNGDSNISEEKKE